MQYSKIIAYALCIIIISLHNKVRYLVLSRLKKILQNTCLLEKLVMQATCFGCVYVYTCILHNRTYFSIGDKITDFLICIH